MGDQIFIGDCKSSLIQFMVYKFMHNYAMYMRDEGVFDIKRDDDEIK